MTQDSHLWPHQVRVFDLLMAGKNVILQAPTGSGKTRAALYPFLYALDPGTAYHDRFPHKCIYSVPMRVLAKQFYSEYRQTTERYGLRYGLKIATAIQTGEQQEDRELAADLIFATIDQTLSSFLLAPYSLSRRKANMNAGAVLSSYLVFDEFHLYDPQSTLPTTLEMLRMLKGITPFILMTATFSADMLGALAELLDAEVVPGNEAEREQLRDLEPQQKTRRYHAMEQPLSAEAVLAHHRQLSRQRRSLVICNTVDRARHLYEAIKAQAGKGEEVVLLHSRFLPEDRNRKEDSIRERFARGNEDGSMIVVATQAIEVGLDITSAALHTELAPANAVIQRAGRCARYQGEEGDVYVYRFSQDVNGETIDLCEKVNPYRKQEGVFQATFQQFQQYSGQRLDFAAEQAILSAAHGEQDRQTILDLQMNQFDWRRQIYAVMRGDGYADAGNVIREVFQQQVTIHSDPDKLLDSPFDAPSFGLHPGTVRQYVKAWLEQGDVEWAVKYLREVPDPEQANRSVYTWEEVYTPETVQGAKLIVVNPALAAYSKELGFLPDRGGGWEEQPSPEGDRQEREAPRHTYRLETYEEHVRQVHQAFAELWPELDWAARRLEERFGLAAGSVRRAAELAVLLHDVGKLSRGWQGWVRKYQAEIGAPVEAGQAYAHTTSQSEAHKAAAQRVGKRPTHAVEGAVASVQILLSALGEGSPLVEAAFSAIARHHTSDAAQNAAFRLEKQAARHVQDTLALGKHVKPAAPSLLGVDEEIRPDFGAEDAIATLSDNPNGHELAAFFAYLVLVRALRRADQRGTARGSKVRGL